MPDFDLILRGGTVVTPAGAARRDLGVAEGRIAALAESLAGRATEEWDVGGMLVLPGLVDPHVHFNEPGREDWEGLDTGTRALAAGGGTMFFDMPLNSAPPVLDAAAFAAKRVRAERKSRCDFALWGGLTPANLRQMPELAECGVIGFKAFLSSSGTDDFPRADTATLLEGMKLAASLGLVVAVHAENESICAQLARRAVAEGRLTMRDYLASRPAVAELEAVQRTILMAWETGCAVHFCHISTGAAVQMITDGRLQGANLTCEACPHHLLLTDEDATRLGAAAKCAPPLRSADEQAALWERLLAGEVDWIASDHSPAPPAMKQGDDFFRIWGGIAGAQLTLPLMLTETRRPDHAIPLERLAELLAGNPARRFGFDAAKGRLAPGADADLAVVALTEELRPVCRDELHDRHRLSPWLGWPLRARVVRTVLRGRTTFLNDEFPDAPPARLVRPGEAAREEEAES